MDLFERYLDTISDYFAALRAEHPPVRYPVDPWVEVFHLRENVYSLLAKSPGLGGDPWMHVVIGPERALVIDTAYGIGDLKGLVETLTDKPYLVVNTHFHGDHSLGNYQFDRVYCHRCDEPYLRKQMSPSARDGFVPVSGSYFTAEDLVPIRDYEIVPVEDGYIFDLGQGYEVELIHLPGHAPGGCGLLDRQNSILFTGDALAYTPTLCGGSSQGMPNREYMTVVSFRTQLLKLEAKRRQFDVIFPGHCQLEFPASVVEDMIRVCEAIIADPDAPDAVGTVMNTSMKLMTFGAAAIAYTDDRVF